MHYIFSRRLNDRFYKVALTRVLKKLLSKNIAQNMHPYKTDKISRGVISLISPQNADAGVSFGQHLPHPK